MRITYIHQHFRHPGEAGGTRSWEFARRLAADGHTVTIVAAGEPHPLDESATTGVVVRRIPTQYHTTMGEARRLVAFLQFSTTALTVASSIPADVVVATSTPLTVAVPGWAASRRWKAPLVLEIRDVWPEVPIALGYLKNPVLRIAARALEAFAYRSATRIIALSPGMQSSVASRTDKPVAMIPNACDFELFEAARGEREQVREDRDWGRPTLVYAGGLGASYHPDWLCEMAVVLAARGVDLVCFGAGGDLSGCRETVRRAGLAPERVFPGPLSKAQMGGALAAADAALSSLAPNPTLDVNSLNKVFDGFAAGKPLFFNHGGWLTQAAAEVGAGWRVPESDVEEAGDIIAEHMGRPEWLSQAGRAAALLGRNRFDRDRLYEQFRHEILTASGQLPPPRPVADRMAGRVLGAAGFLAAAFKTRARKP